VRPIQNRTNSKRFANANSEPVEKAENDQKLFLRQQVFSGAGVPARHGRERGNGEAGRDARPTIKLDLMRRDPLFFMTVSVRKGAGSGPHV
jgi:hypothetical protein